MHRAACLNISMLMASLEEVLRLCRSGYRSTIVPQVEAAFSTSVLWTCGLLGLPDRHLTLEGNFAACVPERLCCVRYESGMLCSCCKKHAAPNQASASADASAPDMQL